MRIVDLTPEHTPLYFACLEEYSPEMREAGDHKARWYESVRDRGLRVKLAEDDDGRIAGMIQYLPIELSPAEGRNLYFVLCIWVHGHKQGPGNRQHRGLGRALLAAAEADARALGAAGLAAWGLRIPAWMRASWFRRQGYQVADRQGMMALGWKAFTEGASPPRWLPPGKAPAAGGTDRVQITALVNGWCPAQNLTLERARRAAAELGDRVAFETIDTRQPAVARACGRLDGLFIDGKELRSGPPPSYDRVRRRITRALRRKHLA